MTERLILWGLTALLVGGCAAVVPMPTPEESRLGDWTMGVEGDRSIDPALVDYPLLAAAVLAESNRQRRRHGLDPLERSARLEAVATMHAKDMVMRGFFSHTNPVEAAKRTLGDRLRIAGLDGSFAAENIADTFVLQIDLRSDQPNPYTTTLYPLGEGRFSLVPYGEPIPSHSYSSFARDLVKSWIDSPSHRVNLLTRRGRYLGCGCRHKADVEGVSMLVCVQVFYTP